MMFASTAMLVRYSLLLRKTSECAERHPEAMQLGAFLQCVGAVMNDLGLVFLSCICRPRLEPPAPAPAPARAAAPAPEPTASGTQSAHAHLVAVDAQEQARQQRLARKRQLEEDARRKREQLKKVCSRRHGS
jgi:hypothetical protein